MKALRILLAIAIVFSAFTAMAAQVNVTGTGTLNGQPVNGQYTLDNIAIDANGNITVCITGEVGGTSPCSNTAPTISLGSSSLSVQVNQPCSNTFTVSDTTDSGGTISISANVGNVSATQWDDNGWSTAGQYTVTLTATEKDSTGATVCNGISSKSFTVNVTDPNAPPTTGTPINRGQWVAGVTSTASPKIYNFKIPQGGLTSVAVQMNNNLDVNGNVNLIVGLDNVPATCPTYGSMSGPVLWYKITSGSNENITMSTALAEGRTVYIKMCGSGGYKVIWN